MVFDSIVRCFFLDVSIKRNIAKAVMEILFYLSRHDLQQQQPFLKADISKLS